MGDGFGEAQERICIFLLHFVRLRADHRPSPRTLGMGLGWATRRAGGEAAILSEMSPRESRHFGCHFLGGERGRGTLCWSLLGSLFGVCFGAHTFVVTFVVTFWSLWWSLFGHFGSHFFVTLVVTFLSLWLSLLLFFLRFFDICVFWRGASAGHLLVTFGVTCWSL